VKDEASTSVLPAGSRLGPYEIVALIGAGAMGEVYRARDPRLGRDVAIKVLLTSVSADPDRLRRFEQEARAAGALNHTNILAVFDVGTHDGQPYVVSELLEGETLRSRMGGSRLPVRKAIDYAGQIARGLAAAHEKGIVHRDLKPENLFVTKDGRVKILDFGLAKLTRPEVGDNSSPTVSQPAEDGTTPGAVIGTVGYMSPEQVKGLTADHRSDIFSFGSVLYEMLSGRRAFKGETAPETMTAILRQDPPVISWPSQRPPPSLERILHRCLEKSPEERFQSAKDLAFDLEAISEVSTPGGVIAPIPAVKRRWLVAALGGVALAGAGFFAGQRSRGAPALPSFQRLTFRQGTVWSARFAPDGQTIVYSASWQGKPMEVFSTRRGSRESRPLGLPDAKILSISASNEMALLLRPALSAWITHVGTLARAPLAGGAPREILEDVQDADWSPSGRDLAVVRWMDGRSRLEFPIGKVLYEPAAPAWISSVCVGPQADRIAFLEHPVAGDERGSIAVVDLGGRKQVLADGFVSTMGLYWPAGGDELWLFGSRLDAPDEMHVLNLSGQERLAARFPGPAPLLDVARDRSLLLRRVTTWTETWGLGPGEARERDLSEQNFTFPADLSADGRMFVGSDMTGKMGGSSVYVRKTDGSPAVWIGEGEAQALSPDGKWVLTRLARTSPEKLVRLPTGAGEAQPLEGGGVTHYAQACWFPDGNRVLFAGAGPGRQATRLYVEDLTGGGPRALTLEGVALSGLGNAVSPDGRRIVALGERHRPVLYSSRGGEPIAVRGLEPGDLPIGWTLDSGALFFVRADEVEASAKVYRVDLSTGRQSLWKQISVAQPMGMVGQYRILITPDGKHYVYNYTRHLGELFLAEGIR